MSPTKFYDEAKKPSALKINKDSHLIQKSSSSTSSSSNSSTLTGSKPHPPPTQQRHPVIIYTHSPKIIHTKARDFMALVQKLTGLSRSESDGAAAPPQPAQEANPRREAKANNNNNNSNNNNMKNVGQVGQDDTGSSSVITEENCDVQVNSSSVSPPFDQPGPYLSDVPLFAPTPSDYFCSPRPLYRYPDHMFASPNMGVGVSPGSMLEVFKGYQDYCN